MILSCHCARPHCTIRLEGDAQVHPIIKLRQVKGTVLSTAGRAISSLPQNMPAHRLTAPMQSQQQVTRSDLRFHNMPS